MTTIYLVRHATYENPDDICARRLPFPLSEEGRAQALKLQRYFAPKDIAKIYSSVVERCKETAEIIADGKIEIEYDQRLLETLTAGQGRKGNNGYNYYGYRDIVGGENNQAIQDRMINFFRSTNWEEGKNYIICSHGDPLYFLYLYLKELPIISDIKLDQPIPEYPNYPARGSILPLTYIDGDWEVGAIINQVDLK